MPDTKGAGSVDNIHDLQTKLQAEITAGRELLKPYEGKAVPQTITDQFKRISGNIDGLRASLDAFKSLSNVERELAEPTQRPIAWRPSVGNEGNDLPIDTQSWRTYEAKNIFGETRTFRYNVPIAVSRDSKHEKIYGNAFELYCRKGVSFVRDNYPLEWKALSEGTDTAGGFSVPVDFHAELIKKIAMMAQIRPNATVFQTNRDVAIFPRINYSASASDDSGNKRYTSPVRLTWTGELPASSTTARVTDQVFGQNEIKVNTAIASQLLSNDLIEDGAFDIAGYASDTMGEAFALGEDYAFLQGSGAAQPLGITTTAGATNGIPYQASGTSADIQNSGDSHSGKRILDVFYNLPAQYRRNAAWMMSSLTEEAVENLVDGNKRPIISSLLTASIAVGQPDVIKGRPVMVDEFVPEIAASSFSIVLGDWKGYYIADRVQFSIQRFSEIYVETNFTLLLARKRVGGLCVEPWKFQAMKCATS